MLFEKWSLLLLVTLLGTSVTAFGSPLCPVFLQSASDSFVLKEHRKKHLPSTRILKLTKDEYLYGSLPVALTSLTRNPFESLLIVTDSPFPLDVLLSYLELIEKKNATASSILEKRVRILRTETEELEEQMALALEELEVISVRNFLDFQADNLSRIRREMEKNISTFRDSEPDPVKVDNFVRDLNRRYMNLVIADQEVYSYPFMATQDEHWLWNFVKGVRRSSSSQAGDLADQRFFEINDGVGNFEKILLFDTSSVEIEHPSLSKFFEENRSFYEWIKSNPKLNPFLYSSEKRTGILFEFGDFYSFGVLSFQLIGHGSLSETEEIRDEFVRALYRELEQI